MKIVKDLLEQNIKYITKNQGHIENKKLSKMVELKIFHKAFYIIS